VAAVFHAAVCAVREGPQAIRFAEAQFPMLAGGTR
jgi:hypothetical protein